MTQLSTPPVPATLSTPATNAAPQNITLPATRGLPEVPALLWTPHAAEAAPALVMLPDWFGLDETLQRAAARLCAAGYAVLAPDLTHGTNAPAPDASSSDLGDWALKQSDAANVKQALRAAEWLGAHEGVDAARLGLLGWGWGGALALMAAAHEAPVRVVCDIGGIITYPVSVANRPGSPLNFVADLDCVIFAAFAGDDPVFPDDEIQRLRAHIVDHDKVGEVKSYQAPARFWRSELPQTEALWRRLTHFLAENLSGLENGSEPLGPYPNEEARLQA